MRSSKKKDYLFNKIYLYPRRSLIHDDIVTLGYAEIVNMGDFGTLDCFVEDMVKLNGGNSDKKFYVVLSDDTGHKVRTLGFLNTERSRYGRFTWDFKINKILKKKHLQRVIYKIQVIELNSINSEPDLTEGIILEGIFTCDFEILPYSSGDLKKEAKEESGLSRIQQSQIFKKVEPFQPPMPDYAWWQISFQPASLRAGAHIEACPKQRTHKTIF